MFVGHSVLKNVNHSKRRANRRLVLPLLLMSNNINEWDERNRWPIFISYGRSKTER